MITLAVVYAALAALLSLSLTFGRVRTWVRVLTVVGAPVVAFGIWQAAQPPTGWPAHVAPPRGEFRAGYVREPEPDDPGEIDLWVVPPGASQPRAYKLPYSRKLHKQVDAATKQGSGVGVQHGESRGEFVFYRLPPPDAGRKD